MTYLKTGLVALATEYMRCARGARLGDVARHCGVSLRTLERALREETGRSFRELRTQLLLAEAVVPLMGRPCCSIKELSSVLGFSTQEAFTHWFARLQGCSPSSYRKAQQHPAPGNADTASTNTHGHKSCGGGQPAVRMRGPIAAETPRIRRGRSRVRDPGRDRHRSRRHGRRAGVLQQPALRRARVLGEELRHASLRTGTGERQTRAPRTHASHAPHQRPPHRHDRLQRRRQGLGALRHADGGVGVSPQRGVRLPEPAAGHLRRRPRRGTFPELPVQSVGA